MSRGLDELGRLLTPETRIATSQAERTLYSRDCWPWLTLQLRDGSPGVRLPQAIVFARTEEDVVQTVRWCAQSQTPLLPIGGGSGVVGSGVPVQGGIILDMKQLDFLDTSQASGGLIHVGAGWVGSRLEHELNRQNLSLGHFPSSILCSTLGGWLATRSAGQLSSRHGKIEDMVVSIRFVDARGEIRQSWTQAWDTTQLLVGSEGTLGVILSAWLRVEPHPAFRAARGYVCPGVEGGFEAMRRILQSGHRPAVMRLYDEFDTWISGARKAANRPDVEAEAPEGLVRSLAGWAKAKVGGRQQKHQLYQAANAILSRVGPVPRVLNHLSDRVSNEALLILGVEESCEELLEAQAADVFEIAGETLQDLGEKPGEHWYANRYAVSYKMSPMLSAGMFVDTMEVATTWENLNNLYRSVRREMAPHAFVMAHFSHAYVTGSSIYFTFAGFGRPGEDTLERYQNAWEAAMSAVAGAGGAVTHHHGVGLMKGPALDFDHRGGSELFGPLKAAADPEQILNPGKLWETREAFLR